MPDRKRRKSKVIVDKSHPIDGVRDQTDIENSQINNPPDTVEDDKGGKLEEDPHYMDSSPEY